MSKNLRVGDKVFVPRGKIGLDTNAPKAFAELEILAIKNRSVELNLPNNGGTKWIGTSQLRDPFSILLVTIGDFETEETLLHPLGKSILQFLRLIEIDDNVFSVTLRSKAELKKIWQDRNSITSHVIIIGHGSGDAIKFGIDGSIKSEEFSDIFSCDDSNPKVFISLCCKTGYAKFAQDFSKNSFCHSFIAPFHSVHGAIASQFCQHFLCGHLITGYTDRVAFKSARESCASKEHFRFWRRGKFQ